MKPKKTKSEKREVKKRKRMPVSGKSVLKIKEIILNKAKKSKTSWPRTKLLALEMSWLIFVSLSNMFS